VYSSISVYKDIFPYRRIFRIMNSEIRLDGTARSPEDAVALHDLGLQFTEIPINDEASFLPFKAAY
jgi:hypothetical protein